MRSATALRAESMRIGVSESSRTRRATVIPSTSGSMRSRTMSRIARSRIALSAARPSAAVTTANPSRSRYARTSWTIFGSSSTTRIGGSSALLAISSTRQSVDRDCDVSATRLADLWQPLRTLLLVRGDIGLTQERDRDVVESREEARARMVIERERGAEAGGGHEPLLDVHRDLRRRVRADRVDEPRHDRLRELHRDEAVRQGVALEDVREARRDDRAEPGFAEGPHGVLARRP